MRGWSELAAAADAGYVLLAGRYEGIDERLVVREVDEEIAIGDFVVSGGELPALMLIDAIARQLPGALNDARVGARRIRSSTGCSIARTTRGRRCTKERRCPTCCCRAIMRAIRALAAEAVAGADAGAAARPARGPGADEGRGRDCWARRAGLATADRTCASGTLTLRCAPTTEGNAA